MTALQSNALKGDQMTSKLIEEVIKLIETEKGHKLTPDELAKELNGMGLMDLVEKVKQNNLPKNLPR